MFFRKPREYRVVEVKGGFVPQVFKDGEWEGISSDLDTWTFPSMQYKHCIHEGKDASEAYKTLSSYKNLVE